MKVFPLISVVTVSFNAVSTIEDTIINVISQSYPNIEYIIIDGGSTDGTVEIIKKYRNKISYWVSESDKGLYDAMNKGIIKAKGEWIHFRNCGDYFYRNDIIEQIYCRPILSDIKVIHGNCRIWDCYGYVDKTPAILSKSYKSSMPVFHPSAFIRSDLHKEMLFDLSYKLSSDYNFFFTCFERGVQFQYLPILISVFDARDGLSAKQRIYGLLENFKLKGNKSIIRQKLMFYFILIQCNLRLLLKKALSKRIIQNKQRKNRENENWIIIDTSNRENLFR